MKGFGIAVILFVAPVQSWAGQVNAEGNVTIISDRSSFSENASVANFDDGPIGGQFPMNLFESGHLVFQEGQFSSILPGTTSRGFARRPRYINRRDAFENHGGQTNSLGTQCQFCGVATFDKSVTRVGLIASKNGTQFLTAWDQDGSLIGQVTWIPQDDSGFLGIDTGERPIAMIAYGNDDVFNGVYYDHVGTTTWSDSWVWEVNCDHDGKTEGTEECDDGNSEDGDGCNAECKIEILGCGNGTVEEPEVCDDGNQEDGDGCSADCRSNETCGNKFVDLKLGETCDDGNLEDGDGCSGQCLQESQITTKSTEPEMNELEINGGGCNSNHTHDFSFLLSYVFLLWFVRRQRI